MRIGHIGTLLHTWLHGELVGEDQAGNRYFRRLRRLRRSRRANNGREERWVIYGGEVEASRVPPEWHGWLHHMDEVPPTARSKTDFAWIKPHKPNLTGTPEAYLPAGHALQGGHRAPATGDYEAWRPK